MKKTVLLFMIVMFGMVTGERAVIANELIKSNAVSGFYGEYVFEKEDKQEDKKEVKTGVLPVTGETAMSRNILIGLLIIGAVSYWFYRQLVRVKVRGINSEKISKMNFQQFY